MSPNSNISMYSMTGRVARARAENHQKLETLSNPERMARLISSASKQNTSTHVSPELAQLQNMSASQLRSLLQVYAHLASAGSADKLGADPSPNGPTAPSPAPAAGVQSGSANVDQQSHSYIQRKIDELPEPFRQKFLVADLNLDTKKTTIQDILYMIMAFAPSAKPSGPGYIRKSQYIEAYEAKVKPLLTPFLPPSVAAINASGSHFQGYPWDHYLSSAFNPSSRRATIDVLTSLLEYFVPDIPRPTTREALEACFRRNVWHQDLGDVPPPYSVLPQPCQAPFHAKLTVNDLRFTLQMTMPTVLIPVACHKTVLVKLYEIYVHRRKRMADDPVIGLDYYLGPTPVVDPLTSSSDFSPV